MNAEGDSVQLQVPPFHLFDQYHNGIDQVCFEEKITIVDFIFLSCPTICPKMTSELKLVYSLNKNEELVNFLSITIDPEKDGYEQLQVHAKELGLDYPKWSFLRGEKDSIYRLAEQGFFATAFPDSTAPGGIVHSGGIYLVDKKRHIRGVYDGTEPKETQRLIKDIEILKLEYRKK
jgi:protein SCO1